MEERRMKNSFRVWLPLLALGVMLVTPLLAVNAVEAADLQAAINTAAENGKLDLKAPPGFLGIPGAPSPSLVVGFFWAIWVGWIFSTVGAFGGIMAGVGHISIFGVGEYAKSFG
jgi:hypothetical protein